MLGMRLEMLNLKQLLSNKIRASPQTQIAERNPMNPIAPQTIPTPRKLTPNTPGLTIAPSLLPISAVTEDSRPVLVFVAILFATEPDAPAPVGVLPRPVVL